jgi:hypothetical protein
MPWQQRLMLLPTFGTVLPVGKAEAWFVATNCPTFRDSPLIAMAPIAHSVMLLFPFLLFSLDPLISFLFLSDHETAPTHVYPDSDLTFLDLT